jgi:hypothetical protein
MISKRQSKSPIGLDLNVRKQLLESFEHLEQMKIIRPIDRQALYSAGPHFRLNDKVSKLLSDQRKKS